MAPSRFKVIQNWREKTRKRPNDDDRGRERERERSPREHTNNTQHVMDTATVCVLTIGVLLRLGALQMVPNMSNVLDQFVLFSTPINSYRSLNEGIFLLSSKMNPYSHGEIIHHPPLLLWFFNVLKSSHIEDNFNTNLFYSLMDLFMCLQFIKMSKKLNGENSISSFKLACFHMFNPFTLLTTFSKSTHILNNFIVVSVCSCLVQDQVDLALILLAISSYLTYYTWSLVIPIAYYTYRTYGCARLFRSIGAFIVSLAILLGISYRLSNNSLNFISLCYVTILKFKKITPNSGLWWYFFTEIFDFFNDFYLAVFNIYGLILILPLSMRFIRAGNKMNLLFVTWITLGIINFSRAYPVLADYSLFYSSVVLFSGYYANLKFSPIVSYLALFVVLLQAPTFYVVWMVLNSGNANFFYAIGLALALVQGLILGDFLWSFIQSEYYSKQGLEKCGKEPVALPKLTQI